MSRSTTRPAAGGQPAQRVAAAGRAGAAGRPDASGSAVGPQVVDRRARRRAPRGGAGRAGPGGSTAQLAVIRYSQVENCASPRNRLQPPVGPQVRLLDHVACVLLVAGEPVAPTCRCRRTWRAPARRRRPGRPPWQRRPARPRQLASRVRPATWRRASYVHHSRVTDCPARGSSGSPCAPCGDDPTCSTSSARCARGR